MRFRAQEAANGVGSRGGDREFQMDLNTHEPTQPLLTISVAAYNVTGTIRECLESCLLPDLLDKIEIIAVDDGSTDETLKILREYEKRYPNTVRSIHKSNGGYGSTVNTSLKAASGKYFRLLDGDDWVDGKGLTNLIHILSETDVDIIIAPYVERGGNDSKTVDQTDGNAEGLLAFSGSIIPRHLSMHSIVYRTQLVRESGVVLPEHRLYTDTLYNVIPLQYVQKAFITHVPVYQYRVNQIGQSVSRQSLEAHHNDLVAVVQDLMDAYSHFSDKQSLASQIAQRWIVGDAIWAAGIMAGMKPSNAVWNDMKRLFGLMAVDEELFVRCCHEGRAFKLFSKVPRWLYPFCSGAYRILSNRMYTSHSVA